MINFNLSFLSHRIEESEAARSERLDKWKTYLENEDAKKEIAEDAQQSDAAEQSETSMNESPKIESS